MNTNIQTIQGRAANILKSLGGDFIQTENLLKAEGSRGGKVIGHTKSGKPIYDHFSHSGHKEFTKEDHKDAYKKHADIASGEMNREKYDASHAEYEKHYAAHKNFKEKD